MSNNNEIKIGDKVQIKEGTILRSAKSGTFQAGRTYIVTVQSLVPATRHHVGVQVGNAQDGDVLFDLEHVHFHWAMLKNGLNNLREAVELQEFHDLKLIFEEKVSSDSTPQKNIYWEEEPRLVEWVGSAGFWISAAISDVEKV